MGTKVLVTYASKYGGTAGIAQAVCEVLQSSGIDVETMPVQQVGSLADYQAVILGSAVYYGRWRGEAVKFLNSFQADLMEKDVWFFSSGPAGKGDPVELLDGWTFPAAQQEIADRVQPRDAAVFHGVIDQEKMNFFEKWILKNMDTPAGDYRDWELITSWAKGIAADLGR